MREPIQTLGRQRIPIDHAANLPHTFSVVQSLGSALFYAFSSLFALKIAWNVLVPVILAWRAAEKEEADERTLPMFPHADFLILGLVAGLSFLVEGNSWGRTLAVILAGFSIILASYLLCLLAGATSGWMLGIRKRRQELQRESPK